MRGIGFQAAPGSVSKAAPIWAGFTDLTAGNTVDKANTRWGRLRPWILFGSLPLAAMLVGLFSTPAGLDATGAIVWILLFDAGFQLAYSFVNIPYGSLSAAMTQNPVDRSRLAGARSIGGSITGVVLAIVLSPQFANTKADGIRLQFTITTLVLAAIAIVLYILCFLNTREVVPRSGEKSKFSTTMKMVFSNKPLLILCLGALFLLGGMFTMSAVAMYYAKFVLFNASAFIYLQIAQTVGTVLVASLVPTITVRLGKRTGYVIMAFVVVAAYVVVALVPSLAGNRGGLTPTIMAVVGWFLYGAGTGGTNALMFSMQADTVDYGEWKTGTRAEGGAYSILSFVRKCGQGVGGIIGGAVVGAFGYNEVAKLAKTETLPPAQWTGKNAELLNSAQQGIVLATGWLPAALCVVAAAVIFFYPLGAEQHKSVVSDLNERRAKRAAGVTQTLTATQPVVTINGQYGAGATLVGQQVALKLGIPYEGTKFSSAEIAAAEEARKASVGQVQPTINPFLVSFAEASSTDTNASLPADAEADTEAVAENTREIMSFVKNGGVIVGRDAAMVLASMKGALHVRLVAPVDVRVGRAAERYGISREEAAARQVREDRVRPAMSQRLMKYDQDDPKHYDLVIDTGATSLEAAVEQIVAAARAKRR